MNADSTAAFPPEDQILNFTDYDMVIFAEEIVFRETKKCRNMLSNRLLLTEGFV